MRVISNLKKQDLEDGEDSDGNIVLTSKQKLSRKEAELALTHILIKMTPARMKTLSKGCPKMMLRVMREQRDSEVA